jgi:hypothetical protein
MYTQLLQAAAVVAIAFTGGSAALPTIEKGVDAPVHSL